MNLDLKRFRKISEDKKSAVLKHPDGHQITVAKHILSPKVRSQLSELPLHLEEGTPEQPVQPVDAKSEGMSEERQRSQSGYETQFPDVPNQQQPQQQTQPTIIINNGQPNNAQQTQSAPQASTDYLHGGPFGKDFDFNKYNLQSPDASIGSKMQAMKNMDAEAEAQKNQQEGMARQQERMARDQMAKVQQAITYNQKAAALGFPPIPVPQMPDMPMQVNQAKISSPLPPSNNEPEVPQGPTDPYGMNQLEQGMLSGFQKQQEGITNQAKAEGELGQAQANVLNQQIQQQKDTQTSYQDHYNALENERQAFMQDLKNEHIDPQHYLNSMGVGSKIATGIGLILGGMGGGLMHQGNPALDFLNKQISNDIDSQKMDLGKKENLLSANMRQFGNLKDATDMTRIMQMDIVGNQLKEAAAKAQDPLVQARALKEYGVLEQQRVQAMSQFAMRKTLMSGGMGGQNLDTLRMLNPEMAKSIESRLIPNVGVASVPVPEKIREELVTRNSLDRALKDLSLFAENNSGSLNPAVINEGRAKANLVQDLYRRANGQGVFREAEKEFVGSIIGEDPTKFFKNMRTQPRYKAAIEDNFKQLNGLKEGYGLPVQKVLDKNPPVLDSSIKRKPSINNVSTAGQ